jgi:hypothetical protein
MLRMLAKASQTLLVALMLVAMAGDSALAGVIGYTFKRFTSNSSQGQAIEPQLLMVVSSDQRGRNLDLDANQAWFHFTNAVGIPSSITGIYWDDTPFSNIDPNFGAPRYLDALVKIVNESGVCFTSGGTPPNLPGGQSLRPPFLGDFRATTLPPTKPNGVDAATDIVKVKFTLKPGKTLADVISALNLNILRVGLHVQAIGVDGQSDSYLHMLPGEMFEVVPEPASGILWLLGLGLVGAHRLRRMRRRTKNTSGEAAE